MSNKFPVYSPANSNNSGANASSQRHVTTIDNVDILYDDTIDRMNVATATREPVDPSLFQGDADAPSLSPTISDVAPSSPSSAEASDAIIEVITVEKYQRSDGFANPYHIQGLNASTPDDVDDEDDDEEDEVEVDVNLRKNSVNRDDLDDVDFLDSHTPEGDYEENTLKTELEDDEPTLQVTAITSRQPSIPTSNESTTSSESRRSNTSSLLPVPSMPRTDSVVSQPQRLFKFTVERVPSSEGSVSEQTSLIEQQSSHITPPMSVTRAPTSESIFVPDVQSDNASIDETIAAEPSNLPKSDVPPSGATPWMPSDYQPANAANSELTSPLPQWATAEMAAAAAATAAVASAVVNPVVGPHSSQALPISQATGPHFSLAVAAASAAVAAMNNMMIDVPSMTASNVATDLSAFAPKAAAVMRSDMTSSIHAFNTVQTVDEVAASLPSNTLPTNKLSLIDYDSPGSPGTRLQYDMPTPPQPSINQVDTQGEGIRPLPVGAEDAPVETENDEGEIRFRRARFLEKRERWHDKRFLVVDTFRREEPAARPNVNLPDPVFPVNCSRCLTRLQQKPTKPRVCPCSNLDASILQQKVDRYRYTDHNGANHGFVPNRNNVAFDNHFGYSGTLTIIERANQFATGFAATMKPTNSPTNISNNAKAVGTAAAAAVASLNNANGPDANLSCSPSNNSFSALALRRNRLQRNNSHFNIARSSPSSFSANEFPQLDKVAAAMAAAAVVSVTAAMKEQDRRGMHSERSSETEVDHPLNPPTSPASGLTRDSLNRSSSMTEAIAGDNRTIIKKHSLGTMPSAMTEPTVEEYSPPPVERPSAPVVNQSNAAPANEFASHSQPSDNKTRSAANTGGQESVQSSTPVERSKAQGAVHPTSGQYSQTVADQTHSQSSATYQRPTDALSSQQGQKETHHQQHHHPKPPGASSSTQMSTSSISGNSSFAIQTPTSGAGTINATETAVAAAYAACGLMMQGGYGGLSVLGGEHSVLGHGPGSVSSNTSSMNYLDQYRMQHCLPVGPTAPSSAAQDAVRQSTEARIAQSLDSVRLAMVSYFRELEEKHTYQLKSLQEEVRQLREQRERDHALIREYVPPECLLQLGQPYTSLASMPPQSSRAASQGPSSNSGPQQVVDHATPSSNSQSYMPPVNSSQSSQPPSQQQPE